MKNLLSLIAGSVLLLSLGSVTVCAELPYDEESELDWQSFSTADFMNENGDYAAPEELVIAGQTVYIPLTNDLLDNIPLKTLTNKRYFDITTDKGDSDRSIIRKISFGTRSFDGERQPTIAITLRDITNDEEYCIRPTVTLTLQQPLSVNTAVYPEFHDWSDTPPESGYVLQEGTPFVINIEAFVGAAIYEDATDYELAIGASAIVKPTRNDTNNIEWTDELGNVAQLSFVSTSKQKNNFRPKLTTDWKGNSHADLLDTTDAFLYDFSDTAGFSATSRAELQIRNPFYDPDSGDYTTAISDIVIYQDVDGALLDISSLFTATENDNGTPVLTIKTKSPGMYIVADSSTIAKTGVQTL